MARTRGDSFGNNHKNDSRLEAGEGLLAGAGQEEGWKAMRSDNVVGEFCGAGMGFGIEFGGF